jgi:hypothetical protein
MYIRVSADVLFRNSSEMQVVLLAGSGCIIHQHIDKEVVIGSCSVADIQLLSRRGGS